MSPKLASDSYSDSGKQSHAIPAAVSQVGLLWSELTVSCLLALGAVISRKWSLMSLASIMHMAIMHMAAPAAPARVGGGSKAIFRSFYRSKRLAYHSVFLVAQGGPVKQECVNLFSERSSHTTCTTPRERLKDRILPFLI